MAFGTLSVDRITNSDGFTLGGSGATMKNRIINGAMVFDQRNAGANTVPTSSGTYTIDRWSAVMFTGTSKYSVQRSNTAPAGFNTSLLVTSTTANTVGSGDYYLIQQPIEGNNIADLGWGTSDAKTVTLSFHVRSSLTGTFGGTIVNHNYSRCYPFTYTINSADTFEQKTITIQGDTSGTWQSNTAAGMLVNFSLGSGSTVSGTAGAWSGTLYTSATGATQLVATNGATLYITGVQLEVGSQATSFDYRQYGTELSLCQRYFQTFFEPRLRGVASGATGLQRMGMPILTTMRAAPTCSISGTIGWYDGSVTGTITSISVQYSTISSIEFDFVAATGTTSTNRPIIGYVSGDGGSILASSEL